MVFKQKQLFLLACSGCALMIAGAASAQTAPAAANAAKSGDESNGDIIVTARRVEERLQDVPISITVFSQQQLTDRNIVNAGDLATYTPSLSINPNYGTEYTSFAIRGFVQDPQTAPTVGVYFGDVVVPRGGAQATQSGDGAGPGSLFDLQNVQVLKGPQGTLQGRNTTGGAVLLVPQKPTSKLEGYLEGSYGNYDMKRIQGVLNIPLMDSARLRIGGDYMKRDGYLRNDSGIGPTRFNGINYYSLRASLVVDLTPNLENYTIASYSRSDTSGSVKKQIACAPSIAAFGALGACGQQAREAGTSFYTVQSDVPNARSLLDQWQVINTTTWHESDTTTIKNIASYGQLKNFSASSLFGNDWRFGIPALGLPVQQFGFSTVNPVQDGYSGDQYTLTEELQLQGNSGRLTYQGGVYLEISRSLQPTGFISQTLIPCASPYSFNCPDVYGAAFSAASGFAFPIKVGSRSLTVGTMNYRDLGIYAQASYALTDTLKLTAGARYTSDKTEATTKRVSYSFNPLPPFTGVFAACTDNTTIAYTGTNCSSSSVQKSHKPTWLIDLDYKPFDDMLLYAKWSRGYRAGGINPQSPTTFRTFGPEKVDAYEGGMKWTLRGPIRGTFNIDGFYNNFTSQQLQAGFFAAPGAPVASTAGPVNAGKSRIYGAEIDSSISPFRGFWIDGSYTWLKAEVRSIATIVNTDPNYTVSYQILPGDPLLLSPRNKFALTARYTLPLAPNVGQITLAATVAHSDHYESTYAYLHNPSLVAALGGVDLGRIQGVTLVNANLDWKNVAGKPIDLSLFVTNLTKKQYYTYTAGLGQVGFESANLGEPRMWGARLRYRFGQ